MRLNEFNSINLETYIKECSPTEISNYLNEHCSEFLNAAKGRWLYRGTNVSSSLQFYAESRTDRKNHATDNWASSIIDKNLKEQGFKALRSNSIFCTRDRHATPYYGTTYIIFPINGFHYTWSPDIRDLTQDLHIATKAIIRHRTNDWSDLEKPEHKGNIAQQNYNKSVKDTTKQSIENLENMSSEEWVNFYKFTNTDLDKALMTQSEILITGKYIGVEPGYFMARIKDKLVR